jgi:hypothetical protein
MPDFASTSETCSEIINYNCFKLLVSCYIKNNLSYILFISIPVTVYSLIQKYEYYNLSQCILHSILCLCNTYLKHQF